MIHFQIPCHPSAVGPPHLSSCCRGSLVPTTCLHDPIITATNQLGAKSVAAPPWSPCATGQPRKRRSTALACRSTYVERCPLSSKAQSNAAEIKMQDFNIPLL